MDQLLLTRKVPTSSRPGCPRIQAHSSTHRWRQRAQLDLREYIGQDGPQLHEFANTKQSSLLRHRPRKLFYTNWLCHSPNHIWYRTKLPNGVHQVRSSRLRIFLPCHTRKTGARQVHGSATLRIPTPQDARQYRSPFPARGPPQVLRMRQGSNRSHFHDSSP